LSTRLPIISSRSGRSPRKRACSSQCTSMAMVLSRWIFFHGARQCRHHRRHIGDRADHRQARRQNARARDGGRTWSRMMSACSSTLAANGSPARAVASFTITDSGVFKACARLPTWVRARSTISLFASISALVSRASGAISREFSGEPLGGAGADGGQTVGDALERSEPEPHLEHGGQQQHRGEDRKRDDQRLVEGANLLGDLGRIAGDRTR